MSVRATGDLSQRQMFVFEACANGIARRLRWQTPRQAANSNWNWRRLDERRCAAAIGRSGYGRNGRQDLDGSGAVLAMSGGNECPHRGSGAARGKRSAEAAQLFRAVMCIDIIERRMEVGGCRQHPHANHHRQHDAQASLQAMRMRCEERQCHGQGTISQCLYCASP